MKKYRAMHLGVVLFAGSFLCVAPTFVKADTYPSKPVRLIIPFAAGGITDTAWRVVVPRLSEALGQPIVVDNRPGRGGTIGAAVVARASADGYTLLGTSMSHVISGVFLRNLDYDAINDFSFVAQIGATNQVLLIHPSLQVTSVKQLISLAKAKPGQLNFGSSGTGGANHLSFMLFASIANIKVVHVPYKTVGSMMVDLTAGRISAAMIGVSVASPFLKNKRVRALSVSSENRSQFLPDVPTMEESGIKGAEAMQVSGLLAPKGIPTEVARRLEMVVEKVLALQEVRNGLTATGTEVQFRSSSAFSALIAAEAAKWRRIIDDLNIRPD